MSLKRCLALVDGQSETFAQPRTKGLERGRRDAAFANDSRHLIVGYLPGKIDRQPAIVIEFMRAKRAQYRPRPYFDAAVSIDQSVVRKSCAERQDGRAIKSADKNALTKECGVDDPVIPVNRDNIVTLDSIGSGSVRCVETGYAVNPYCAGRDCFQS